MVAAVTVKLAPLSRVRRGRRATRRRPRRSGAGSLDESLISHAWRRGDRTDPASRRTVLIRAARTAGTNVEAVATIRATTTTSTTVASVSAGAPAAPTSEAPGLVSSGAT